MAGFGAKYPCFAPIATEPEGSLPTYGAGAYIGKLNLDGGELYVDGTIRALLYEDAAPGAGRGGFWRRLLG